MKRDYPKLRRVGAELALISPDSVEEHGKYCLTLFGEEVPFFFVSDTTLEIGRRYGLMRKEEHPHGGFYYRSLWILNRDGLITHKSVPWDANTQIAEYQKLFNWVGAEQGEWLSVPGLRKAENGDYVAGDDQRSVQG